MKKREFRRKITALAAAAMLVVSCMTVTAFADGTTGVKGEGNTVTIKKDLKLVDADDPNFTPDVPNVTFSYTIAAVENPGTVYKASDGAMTKVKPGVANALSTTSGNIVFNQSDTVTTSGTDYVASDGLTITFTPNNFPGAGVYRYKITEGATNDNDNVTSLTDKDRYIDVYVENTDSGKKITGYVVTKSTSESNKVLKTEGFTDDVQKYSEDGATHKLTMDANETAETDVSTYTTYDLVISKSVKGNLGDKSCLFEFKVDLTSEKNYDNGIKFKYKYGNLETLTESSAVADNKLTISNLELSDGMQVTIKGIPASMKQLVSEKKHESDTYVVNATVNGTSLGDLTESSGWYAAGTATEIVSSANGNTVAFTNTLASVSPTGLVLKIMPYVLLIALAMILGYVYFGKRSEDK